jgi:hypothetical protein
MSEFIFLYRSTEAEAREHMGTPEKAQQSMQAWMAWMRDLEAKGHLKSPGQPLERSGGLVKGTKKVVTDGPYTETKDLISGFSIVEARDLAQAIELSKGCPILRGEGGSVEVRPVMKM